MTEITTIREGKGLDVASKQEPAYPGMQISNLFTVPTLGGYIVTYDYVHDHGNGKVIRKPVKRVDCEQEAGLITYLTSIRP